MAMSPQMFQELETITCLLSGTSHFTSRLGKVGLAALFFVRFSILGIGGRSIWMEEEKNFICNSTQLLCSPSCFDEFSPISSFNLFALQFVVLFTHALSVTCWNRSAYPANERPFQTHLSRRKIQIMMHMLCLLSRMLIEGVFLFTFYKILGGFVHAAVIHCQSHLCERFVVCTDLNAFTKNVFSSGLCAVSALSIIICFGELIISLQPRQSPK